MMPVLLGTVGSLACGGAALPQGSLGRDAGADAQSTDDGGQRSGAGDASTDSGAPPTDAGSGPDATGSNDAGMLAYTALAVGADSNALQLLGLQSGVGYAYVADYQSTSGSWASGGPLPSPSVALRSIAAAQGTSGGASALQALGVGAGDGHAYVAAWQDGMGAWHAGGLLPAPSTTLSAISPGLGTSGGSPSLQVVGLGASDGFAYLVSWQDTAGNWRSGGLLTTQTTKVTAVATGVGVSDGSASLQVLGLGAADGHVYVVGWQDSAGAWHAGGVVAGQTVALSAIATGNGTTGLAGAVGPALQVVGLAAGNPYVAAWQDSGGNWHAGGALPAAPVTVTALMTANGSRGGTPSLEVFGLGTDGRVYVVAWQDSSGNWNAGQALPGQAGASAFVVGTGWSGGSPSLQVIGLSANGQPYVVAQQDGVGDWVAGATLP